MHFFINIVKKQEYCVRSGASFNSVVCSVKKNWKKEVYAAAAAAAVVQFSLLIVNVGCTTTIIEKREKTNRDRLTANSNRKTARLKIKNQ